MPIDKEIQEAIASAVKAGNAEVLDSVKTIITGDEFKGGITNAVNSAVEQVKTELKTDLDTSIEDLTNGLKKNFNKSDKNMRKRLQKIQEAIGDDGEEEDELTKLKKKVKQLEKGKSVDDDGDEEDDELDKLLENAKQKKSQKEKAGNKKLVDMDEAKKQWEQEMKNRQSQQYSKAVEKLLELDNLSKEDVRKHANSLKYSDNFDEDLKNSLETLKTAKPADKPTPKSTSETENPEQSASLLTLVNTETGEKRQVTREDLMDELFALKDSLDPDAPKRAEEIQNILSRT